MSYDVIENFEVRYQQVLDDSGVLDQSLSPEIDDDKLKGFFESIIRVRVFNGRALNLQREGRLGTYPSVRGQEASQVGSALAIKDDDWVLPSFRETGVLVAMGYPLWMLERYWRGDESGAKCPNEMNILPMCLPVATHIPHVTGVAMAMKYKGAATAAIGYFGEGASSRGDFHEALNIAGVFKAPAVFICQNNQWAISVPRSRQSAAATIAQRAISYGMEGVQVDGNDVIGVYKATTDALERARSGQGPTLIECCTYRLDDHTTADDASRYRPEGEVEQWNEREPLVRLRLLLQNKGLYSEEYEKEVVSRADKEVAEAVAKAESQPELDPAEILRFTSSSLTARQIREMRERGWGE